MPERSFGRTIRYRRTKLGLSQAKLGELVGRSASTIRAWERDSSLPNDAVVITALSAVLGIDRRSLFEKAGLEVPLQEISPTLEEAFASLAAEPRSPAVRVEWESAAVMPLVEDSEPDIELDIGGEHPAETPVEPMDAAKWADEPYPVWEPKFPEETLIRSPVTSIPVTPMPTPAFVDPPEPFVLAPATPPLVEPSYMEDRAQRQLYRVRNLATLVLLVGLGIVLLWALSSTLDALGTWWGDFIGTLKL
ncbi:MAG: helix-turn-helix transcriptional regulator [Acidimicrobiia bacterium]